MDCAEARAALRLDTAPAGLEEHLEGCASCAAELEASLAALRPPGTDGPPPGLLAQVERTLAREHGAIGWLRARPWPVRVVFVAALVGAEAAAILALHRRDDLGVYPGLRMGAILASYGGLLVLLATHALRPLHLAPPPEWLARALVVVGLLAPVLVAALPELPSESAAALGHRGHELFPSALVCAASGALAGAALFLASLSVDRGGDRSARRAWLGCAAAGLGGNLGLQLFCPLNQQGHLLLGHATVGLVLIFLYGLFRTLRRGI